ncbi:MAG: hypothetical protein IJ027_04990 [Oscillospiraceae bacterium]|nr:hypothetical protein [Oscillospiraceae bacterium]
MKKLLAAIMAVSIFAVLLCSCNGSPNGQESSELASSEAAYSEVETSSEASSEEEESSSEASSEQSSSEEETSSEESSSRIPVGRPGESSEEISSEQTSSRGQAVVLSVDPADALSIGVYHFSPSWARSMNEKATVENAVERYKEFEAVLAAGYFNTVIVPSTHINDDTFWDICEHYGISVWMSLYSFYNSEKTDIDSYMSKNVDPYMTALKADSKRWELFCGFHHEETIWRGQSNADYLEMTKALYQKYGKRNFTVFATGEFTGYEGNQLQIEMDAADMKKVNPAALKYTTDMAYDSYSVDVRTGASNGKKYQEWQNVSPNIVDGQSYYREHTKIMLEMLDHDVNVWFFPCSYTTSLWGGLNGLTRADEGYCLAHLNFFYQHLKEQKYQGGIFLYTYYQFREAEKGLRNHLVVEDWAGNQLVAVEETEKWRLYSNRLREITSEFKNTKANHATFK